jgi:O-antigen/teichoic acid export membrane protein
MLLVGRMLSLATNFLVQILTVRYLTKSDYGAFAWALSITSLGASFVVFGLDKTITRFAPIYQKQNHYDKLFGSLIMMVATILALGAALVLLVFGGRGFFIHSYSSDHAFMLLLILIFLSPIQALDEFFVGMFAVFAKPRAIFFRKHVLGPGLKLCAVLVLIFIHGNVYFLAKSYLAAGILGVLINVSILVLILYDQELFFKIKLSSLKMPVREIYSFAVPLLSSVLALSLRSSMVVVLTEYFHSTSEVAVFRAVYPVARLNTVVLQSFAYLFTPLAAGMFAQNDTEGISYIYQKSAIWIAVVSFPIFIVSFSLAEPLAVFLFGTRYAQSGPILALLALGFYFSVALGFTDLTLRVFGKVGKLFVIDIVTIVFSLGMCLWLIPRYGALGSAISASSALVMQNILKVTALHYSTGLKVFQTSLLRVFLTIIASTAGLLIIQLNFQPPLYVGLFLSLLIALVILKKNRDSLAIAQMFPELQRFSLLNRFLTK